MLGEPDEALFLIDAASGAIVDCNAPAQTLLGIPRERLLQLPWARALPVEAAARDALDCALADGGRVALPPFLLRRPGSGYCPRRHGPAATGGCRHPALPVAAVR